MVVLLDYRACSRHFLLMEKRLLGFLVVLWVTNGAQIKVLGHKWGTNERKKKCQGTHRAQIIIPPSRAQIEMHLMQPYPHESKLGIGRVRPAAAAALAATASLEKVS